ncbi:sushi, von Willebrand factor type A, EGF and pentraxin domain-containing protein 1-like [Styela clava]
MSLWNCLFGSTFFIAVLITKIEGDCLEIPETDHTFYTCTDGLEQGSVCAFVCDSGMEMHGSAFLKCIDRDGNDTWSEIHPVCTNNVNGNSCPPITTPGNGTMSCSNEFIPGSICTFDCDGGFYLSNLDPIVCENGNTWSDDPTVCHVLRLCNAYHFYGYADCTDGSSLHSVCSNFRCAEEGKVPDRQIEITCVETTPGEQDWDFSPTCVYECEPLIETIDNGVVTCTAANTENSVCSFSCNDYYLISEVNVLVTCTGSNETWAWDNQPPTCTAIPVHCPEIDPAQLTVSTLFMCTDDNNLGSVCQFQCDSGAELDGNVTKVNCTDPSGTGNGEWSHELPNCYFTTCEEPQIQNGKLECDGPIAPEISCTISCRTGFQPSSSDPITCKKTGQWDGDIPKCKAGPCLPPLDVMTEKVSCNDLNNPGSKCQLTCTESSEAGKQHEFICAGVEVGGASFWSKNLQPCFGCGKMLIDIFILIDASSNLKPWHFAEMMEWLTHLLQEVGTAFDAGSAWVSIALAGSKEPQCDPRNSFSVNELSLLFRNIKLPLLQQKIRSLKPIGGCLHLGGALAQSVHYGVSQRRPHATSVVLLMLAGSTIDDFHGAVTMAKEAGFQFAIIGVANASIINFQQIANSPESIIYVPEIQLFHSASFHVTNLLTKIDCPGFSKCAGPMKFGFINCRQDPSEKPVFNEICSVSCDRGYSLVGNATVLCGDPDKDGTVDWISPLPKCKEIRCSERPPPKDGFMSCTNGNLFPSVCKYFCIPDYFLIGHAQAFCGDPNRDGEGEWSSESPLCLKDLHCLPAFIAPPNGQMQCIRNNTFGSQCHFSCDKGYEITGNGIINCGTPMPDGMVQWSDDPPICEACKSDNCQLDLMVVMDGSGSLQMKEFVQMKEYILEILNEYKGSIDSGGTWVGLIQYSGEATFMCDSGELIPKYAIEFDLSEYSFYEVQQKILNIGHLKGCTATGDAISRATKHFEVLGRLESDRVMIIVTDGKSNDDVEGPAEEARNKNIKLIPIGIGKFDRTELQKISGATRSIIDVESFEELGSSIANVQEEIEGHLEESDVIIDDSGTRRKTVNIAAAVFSVLLQVGIYYDYFLYCGNV